MRPLAPISLVLVVLLASCGDAGKSARTSTPAAADTAQLIATVDSLSGPEGVRYDPDQDVYFVSNFVGSPVGDANGFISRVGPDGVVLAREFMVGTAAAPLHGPRGMFLTGDTLWAADSEGVHAFDRRTGQALGFVDFRAFGPGFLNDIAQGPDGALYVTDTGTSRIFRISGGAVTIALDSPALCQPNGITWDATAGRFLTASWAPGPSVHAWTPGASTVDSIGTRGGGVFDGIEIVGGRVLVSSQADSSLHAIAGGTESVVLRLPGEPADLGIDPKRGHVAVPMIDRNEVQIWRLPEGAPAP